jgi:hypothetical protein
LQDSGLVIRKTLPKQKRMEYHLTAAGPTGRWIAGKFGKALILAPSEKE